MRNRLGKSSGNVVFDVVIIILILLVVAAIMFPMYAQAPEHPRKTSCQTNLKDIAVALMQYQRDYDDTLPSSILYGGSKTWNRENFRRFATERGDLPQSVDGLLSWPELLYSNMKSKDILWCPSDTVDNEESPKSVVSYWYKAAVDRAWYGDGKVYARKEGDFAYPADQVTFYEHNGWHWGQAEEGFKNDVTLNMAFLDGHVAARIIKNSGFETGDIDSAPMAGEPAWFNHNNKTGKDNVGPNWDPKVYSDNLE